MEITDVKLFKTRRRGPVLAYANIILDNQFIIRGIALVEKEGKGRFISMPSRRLRDRAGHYRDICHPLNQEVRTQLTEAVFSAYEEFIENENWNID
ncbi:MAG: septation protein spoVG [Clostridia bacterium]|jgi:stage V sporulation protein G|nr:septation protein spoVG [Clostridia bacterium]